MEGSCLFALSNPGGDFVLFFFVFFSQAVYYTKPFIHNLRETEG